MERLAKQMEGMEFDWYMAITRGGLVPACLLAQITGHTAIDTYCASSYGEDREHGQIVTHWKNFDHLCRKRILIIDDLVDSGKTMLSAVKEIDLWAPKYIETAVLYKKDCSIFEPTYFAEKVPADEWIVFPWEEKQNIQQEGSDD